MLEAFAQLIRIKTSKFFYAILQIQKHFIQDHKILECLRELPRTEQSTAFISSIKQRKGLAVYHLCIL